MFWGFFVRTNATISLTSHFVTTWVKLPGTQIKQKTINKCKNIPIFSHNHSKYYLIQTLRGKLSQCLA